MYIRPNKQLLQPQDSVNTSAVFAINPAIGALDHVGNVNINTSANWLVTETTPFGIGYKTASTDQRFNFSTPASIKLQKFTLIWIGVPRAANKLNGSLISTLTDATATTSPYVRYALRRATANETNVGFSWSTAGSFYAIDSASGALVIDTLNVLAVSYDGTRLRVFSNGTEVINTTTNIGTITYGAGDVSNVFGSFGDNSPDVTSLGAIILPYAANPTELKQFTSSQEDAWAAAYEPRKLIVPSHFATGQRVHYVIYPSTETRIPSQEDIIKGWPGVSVVSDYQSSSQTENLTFNVEAEGLTANTTYKIAFVWYDGVNVSNYTIADFNTAVGSSDVNLTVGGNVQDSTSGTGSVTQVHILVGDTPTQANTSSTGNINTGVTLTVGSDSTANNSSVDSITQVHIVTAGADSSTNTSSTAAVTQVHLIAGDNSSSSSTSSTASITQIQVLATGSDTAANTSSTASISQVHVVAVGSDSTATSSSTGVVTQVQILTAGSDTQAASVPGVTIGSSGNYTGEACAQASTSGTGGITQIHAISVASSSQGNTSSSGSIGSSIDLTIANSDSAANSSTVSISQVHNIAGTSDSVSSSSGVGAITQVQILVADTDSSTNTSSAVNVQQIQQLVVSGSTSSTLSTSVSVEQLHNITVSSASQAVSDSSANISQVHILAITGSDTQISYSSAVSLMSSYQELSSTYVRESSNERFVVEVIPTTFILDTNTGKYVADKVTVRIKA